jgi:hypothetical protein
MWYDPKSVLFVHLFIRFYDSYRRLPETKRHSSLFLHLSCYKFLSVMAASTPSIHVFLERPLFLLSSGIHCIINFDILSSGILLTWPYHCSLFFSMMSTMSGYPFTPIITFIFSFFNLYFLCLIYLIYFHSTRLLGYIQYFTIHIRNITHNLSKKEHHIHFNSHFHER